jgi:hypothetical protein
MSKRSRCKRKDRLVKVGKDARNVTPQTLLYSTLSSPDRGGKDKKPNLCEKSVTHQSLISDLSLLWL